MATSDQDDIRFIYGTDIPKLFSVMLALLAGILFVWQPLMAHFPISMANAVGGLAFMATFLAVVVGIQQLLFSIGAQLLGKRVVIGKDGITLGKRTLRWLDVTSVETGPVMTGAPPRNASPQDGRAAMEHAGAGKALGFASKKATDNWRVLLATGTGAPLLLVGPGFWDAKRAEKVLAGSIRTHLGVSPGPFKEAWKAVPASRT